ncbi:Homeodomain-like protein [Terfezia claveryi]|nr:Homeodomain-like protein [Terfezia claveryi]
MPDQSPFSTSTPGGLETFDQVARLGNKRRRGNLPKHVTDTLRNWLTNHVAHPYPTEEEKQQLCQITGLNMNQISNWFINARRRKLPQQRSDAEQHLLPQPRATTPPRPSPSLGHTRSHSRDTKSILPPPLPPPGPYSSSGR